MSWTPQPEGVGQLAQVLAQSTSSNNNERTAALKALDDAQSQPDLDKYLTYILVTASDSVGQNLRATAGILLKNNVRLRYKSFSPDTQHYIQSQILHGLVDSAALVRRITGNVITTIISQAGLQGWPQVLPNLMDMAENTDNVRAQEGAIGALQKICEDSAQMLDADYNGSTPASYMVPKFLHFTSSQSSKVRSGSIFCLVQFLLQQSQAFLAHIDPFLSVLFGLASDADPETRRHICTAFLLLLEVRPDKLLPHLEGVINYSLHCIKDEDEQLALEGCEFVLSLAEAPIDEANILPHVPLIISVILTTMQYTEMERSMLESADDDDEEVDDKAEDIRPMNVKSKSSHTVEKKESEAKLSSKDPQSLHYNEDEQNVEEDDDEEDEDDDGDLLYDEWSLRKCSAAALDVFAGSYPDVVLATAIPVLKNSIVSPEWHVREAAILAFGAIAEGCNGKIDQHLPSLIPFLVQRLGESEAPVRQISCWTLGRYAPWMALTCREGQSQQYFLPALDGLLKCCLDKNKKVQEAGCSALSMLAESTSEYLAPYLEVILTQLSTCFTKYKAKNMLILYDAVQTIVNCVPDGISDPNILNLLLPPLLNKWDQIPDGDQALCPLFECLAQVVASVGESFAPYAPTVFKRATHILEGYIELMQFYKNDPTLQFSSADFDGPEKDFIITALDLIDGVIIALGTQTAPLVAETKPPLVEMMILCFKDGDDVKQSAFALLGDMAIHTPELLMPYFSAIMHEVLPQIDVTTRVTANGINRLAVATGVCNNAIWSAGEMALRSSRETIAPFVQPLLERLVHVLQSSNQSTVLENTAIAIGRLGKTSADTIGPHLHIFMQAWCLNIKLVEETDEKDTAFQGMCQIIAANPSGLDESNLLSFVEAVSLYSQPSHELAVLLAKVLQGYKSYIPNWDQVVMSKFDPGLAATLRQRYGL